jgi:hypothetical protein
MGKGWSITRKKIQGKCIITRVVTIVTYCCHLWKGMLQYSYKVWCGQLCYVTPKMYVFVAKRRLSQNGTCSICWLNISHIVIPQLLRYHDLNNLILH